MARINQLADLLATIPGVTVFNDGKMYQGCYRNRTFSRTPFVQLQEQVTDTSEHVGGGQDASYEIRGRYTHRAELDSNQGARLAIQYALRDNNLFRLRIDEPRQISPELVEIDFSADGDNLPFLEAFLDPLGAIEPAAFQNALVVGDDHLEKTAAAARDHAGAGDPSHHRHLLINLEFVDG